MQTYEDDIRELETYTYLSNGNPWTFLPSELELLRDNDMNHLRFVWGYGESNKGRSLANYETLTHLHHSNGGRLLQEYTDVLFRILWHVLVHDHTVVFFTDALPKIDSQTGQILETMGVNVWNTMRDIISAFIHEDGVEERLDCLASISLQGTSPGFACLIYTARQIFLLSSCPDSYQKIDKAADIWMSRLQELGL